MDFVEQVGVDRETSGLRDMKELEQQHRAVQHAIAQLRRDCQAWPGHHEVSIHTGGRQQPDQPAPHGHAPATIHKPGAPLVESHRMPVVLLHELFDRQHIRPILKAKSLRQPHLLIEVEDLLRDAGVHVEQRPDTPQKLPGLEQGLVVLTRKNTPVRELLQGARLVPGHPRPLQHMQVTQAAFTLLHIRLEQIHRLTELLILPPTLRDLPLNVAVRPPHHHPPKVPALEVLEQIGAASQKAGFHHRRLNGDVGRGQLDAILDGPDAVAHLEADVPQVMQDLPGQRRHRRAGLRPEQKHDVDVRIRRQLSPAISS